MLVSYLQVRRLSEMSRHRRLPHRHTWNQTGVNALRRRRWIPSSLTTNAFILIDSGRSDVIGGSVDSRCRRLSSVSLSHQVTNPTRFVMRNGCRRRITAWTPPNYSMQMANGLNVKHNGVNFLTAPTFSWNKTIPRTAIVHQYRPRSSRLHQYRPGSSRLHQYQTK